MVPPELILACFSSPSPFTLKICLQFHHIDNGHDPGWLEPSHIDFIGVAGAPLKIYSDSSQALPSALVFGVKRLVSQAGCHRGVLYPAAVEWPY